MNNIEKKYLYWLCQMPGLGAVTIRRLIEEFNSIEDLYSIEGKEISKCGILTDKLAALFDLHKNKLESSITEYENLASRNISFITPLDANYPVRLNKIYDKPMGLYVKGKLPEESMPTAAIIGARMCTPYGKQIAEYMGEALSNEGIQIVSGLAAGIDGAGHRGALIAEKPTFGILGSGINTCYPAENYYLYEQMCQSGGVISEYGLKEPPRARNFPVRNRIISGLSDVIILIEAKEKSGSLITVEIGLEHGKEIFVLPGRITDSLSKGCNMLIKEGANLINSPDDIIEYFSIKREKILAVSEKKVNGLANNEKMLYSCLDSNPKYLGQIVSECKLPIGDCMNALLGLELKGFITETANHYYMKSIR